MARAVKPLELYIKVTIDDEQAQELFEAYDIKFTKKRFKEVIEMIEQDPSALEETLNELIADIIQDEYGE